MIIQTYDIPPYKVIVHRFDFWMATLYKHNQFVRRELWTPDEWKMTNECIRKAQGLQAPKTIEV